MENLFSDLENHGKEVAVSNQTKSNEVTITSLEIAELTGKEHKNVLADIRNLLDKVVDGGVLKFQHTYTNPQNRQEYPFYRLPKREALILVSGYSVELRAKIIDRLEYLENELKKSNAPQLPQTYKEALKELLNQVEENERLQLENNAQKQKIAFDKPKVEYAEAILSADNSQSIGDFAKMLSSKGIKTGQNRFFFWLRENGYLNTDNTPYQKYIDCGYFELLAQNYYIGANKIVGYKTLITAKGQHHFTMKLQKGVKNGK